MEPITTSLRVSVARPKALLLDYGGTLVEEVSVNPRAGNEFMLSRASHRPPHVTLAAVVERAELVSRQAVERRDAFHIELPFRMLSRLIYDYLGVQFEQPWPELELGFWQASVRTRPMPGARDALERFREAGVRIAVLSNTSFGEPVIRYELARYGLTEQLDFVMVSSDYALRKPQVLLFETAAARLGVAPEDIWFVGDRLDTDVAGATAAGMTAVWLRPDPSIFSDDPHLIADSWQDVLRAWTTSAELPIANS